MIAISGNVYIAKEFNAFDYGLEENLKLYGTEEPLKYNLKLVTAPVFILWSTADQIGTEKVLYTNSLSNFVSHPGTCFVSYNI